MQRSFILTCGLVGCLGVTALTARPNEHDRHDRSRNIDFGSLVAETLRSNAEQLFGFSQPLRQSALGPFEGPGTQALAVARGLKVSLVSSAVHFSADQIALWPDDDHPTHVFVCDEETSSPAVQRVDLSGPADANATTIVTGLVACDPVRRTPWGTIIVAEEAGLTGGFYEIFDPLSIHAPINVSNRDAGTTSDPNHLVKHKAVGSLSFESFAIREDGTMIYGDELAPSGGNAGGGIYKFVPDSPYLGGTPITVPGLSPFAFGKTYGLRVAASGSSNWGQAAETGKGTWTAVNTAAAGVVDGNGNILLRNAQVLQKFTGYYRPEDMDIDPIAAEDGVFRACWANTGRMSHGGGSLVENSAVYSEIMCLVEEPPSTAVPAPPTGTIPTVERFIAGDRQANMYDNVAFQPHTGNLVVLEDGAVNVVTSTGTELRGNDLWMCLPDGDDKDTQSDGCVRFASVRDTTAEPTGFIFLGSGEEAFVNIQHRGVDEANSRGTLLRISGFKVDCVHKH
jgi:secreted PhoX family phosphatase